MVKAIFWLSLTAIFYTYIGYPLAMGILAKMRKGIASPPASLADRNDRVIRPRNDGWPTASVIIPVFNEEEFIERKIANCLELDYPKGKLEILIGSDGSTDRTADILKSVRYKNMKYILNGKREGKPCTINQLVRIARGEILFFTDARQLVEKDALKKLAGNFRDEEIGCVSGELLYGKSTSITARGVGLYWEYEKYLRKTESDVYSMIGATGAIYACKKTLFEPLPEDIILDDVYTPLMVVQKGYRAVFDRDARAYDTVAETPRQEHRRKVRTLGGNYQIFFRIPHILNPFKSRLALQIISHKLLRVLMPFFMVTLFLGNMALARQGFYNILFIMQLIFYATALMEALFRRRIKKVFGIPYLFCLLNFSALVGLFAYAFGKMDVKWEKALE